MTLSRRTFLRAGAALCAIKVAPGWASSPRSLAFQHTHTSETLAVTYWQNGEYNAAALAKANYLLRDFRSGEVHPIAPALLDYLFDVQATLGSDAPFAVISGFRSEVTNDMLRKKSGGVSSRSLHMDGRAIDVRISGVKTALLRTTAAKLMRGGVGHYPSSDFVHLDTGRFRQW